MDKDLNPAAAFNFHPFSKPLFFVGSAKVEPFFLNTKLFIKIIFFNPHSLPSFYSTNRYFKELIDSPFSQTERKDSAFILKQQTFLKIIFRKHTQYARKHKKTNEGYGQGRIILLHRKPRTGIGTGSKGKGINRVVGNYRAMLPAVHPFQTTLRFGSSLMRVQPASS
jgi:hypothetical protein